MARSRQRLLTFVEGDDGAAMAEYGILLAFIAIAIIAVIFVLGNQISDKFVGLSASMS